MSSDVLLPLAIFFVLGLPIAVLLWRVLVVGGELRREAQSGRSAIELARRADISLAELADVVDDLRRHKAPPEACGPSLAASAEALRRYALEAAAVDRRVAHGPGAGLVDEIGRAQRAVELIEYGRGLMLDTRGDATAEGETSVKRGYINLLHARDAIRGRAQEMAADAAARHEPDPRWPNRTR